MDDRRDERPRPPGGAPKERSDLTPRPTALLGVGAIGVALMGTMGCTERLPPNPVPRSAGPQELPGWFDPNARWDPKGTDSRIYIEGKIVFDTDKATIRAESERVLVALLAFMNSRPDVTRVRIEGHTDSRASNEHNQELSARRSLSVCNWLVDHGVDHLRLIAVGFGEDRPIGPNRTAPGRQENRRTEFHVAETNGKPWGGQDETNGGLALEVLSAEERAKLNEKPPPPPPPRPFVPEGNIIKPAEKPVEKEIVPADQIAPPPPVKK